MPDEQSDWSAFNRAALSRPCRELLRRTLGCISIEGRSPGIAVDLGCGSGTDSLELLRRGWVVHAVDSSSDSLEMLQKSAGSELGSQLHLHEQPYEQFTFPECDLIWAGYSLPFCDPQTWPTLWQRTLSALRPGGRIAGDLFGVKHAFGSEGDVLLFTESDGRALLAGLEVEAFDVEDGFRPSGGEITRWHAFGFAARKPANRDA
jgi:tellurite methyltransferase